MCFSLDWYISSKISRFLLDHFRSSSCPWFLNNEQKELFLKHSLNFHRGEHFKPAPYGLESRWSACPVSPIYPLIEFSVCVCVGGGGVGGGLCWF